MTLSHVNISMPSGGEDAARSFYAGLLGLEEIPKPEPLRSRGGVWFDAGGLDIHLSIEGPRAGADSQRHFGIEYTEVDGLRAQLRAAGVATDSGRPAPWKRFFVRDPFGNRIEIHEPRRSLAGLVSLISPRPLRLCASKGLLLNPGNYRRISRAEAQRSQRSTSICFRRFRSFLRKPRL